MPLYVCLERKHPPRTLIPPGEPGSPLFSSRATCRRQENALGAADFAPLVGYESLGRDAMLSAPTPDHYLPLLYVLAQHRPGDPVGFPVEGFDGGSISMLAVQLG